MIDCIDWFYGVESKFEKITLRRPKESSNFSSRVDAIVFEVDDRETIGGSAYGGQRVVGAGYVRPSKRREESCRIRLDYSCKNMALLNLFLPLFTEGK